jgi:alpha-ketoglutarate-dependent taurine dioxygenase
MTIEDMARQVATSDVTWRPGRTVIVDNSRLLHRRPAVDETTTRLLRRVHIWER